MAIPCIPTPFPAMAYHHYSDRSALVWHCGHTPWPIREAL